MRVDFICLNFACMSSTHLLQLSGFLIRSYESWHQLHRFTGKISFDFSNHVSNKNFTFSSDLLILTYIYISVFIPSPSDSERKVVLFIVVPSENGSS